jgi:acyl-CoA reductase-like NAD-dependent aldehyde dehydrogenase
MFNSGQACHQRSRLLVPRRLLPEAERLAATLAADYVVGDPADPDTDLGPLITAEAKVRVTHAVTVGEQQGARRVLTQPDAEERFFLPTVFSDVVETMTLAQDEIFGPLVSLMAHDGDDDAIRLANSTRYGLHGAVWSGSIKRADAAARRVRTGQLEINGGSFNPMAPFGGFKNSHRHIAITRISQGLSGRLSHAGTAARLIADRVRKCRSCFPTSRSN